MSKEPCAGVWAPTWLSIFTLTMSAVFMVVTLGGNFLVCIAVIKDRKLRTPFMFILLNLACTDLIVGGLTLPVSVVTHWLEAVKTKKNFHVLIIHMTYFITCIASVLNLTALCADRFCAVSWPLKYRSNFDLKVCAAISISIWVLAIGVSMLYWLIGYTNLLFIYAHTALGVALTIAAVTYHISRKLRIVAKTRSQTIAGSMNLRQQDMVNKLSPASRATLRTKSERNVTSLLLTVLTMFIMCHAPAIVMMYILKWCIDCNCDFRHVLRDLTFLFIVSSSAVIPFVCALRLQSFRRVWKAMFCARKHNCSITASSEVSEGIR